MQPQLFEVPPPPQLSGGVQVPHASCPPQPFEMLPQFLFWAAQVVGVQPQTLGVPAPPQLWGDEHVPQFTEPPHPSGMLPQFLP